MFPATLLPVPIRCWIAASRAVIVPNCACPSERGLATAGTVMSWIIHPSYQPLSLLMTNSGEMLVQTSLKARGFVGSVGSPDLGSSTTRTAPTVGSPQFPPGGGQLHVAVIHSGDYGSKHVGFETGGVQQVILKQLAGPVSFVEHLQRQIRMRPIGQLSQPILQWHR